MTFNSDIDDLFNGNDTFYIPRNSNLGDSNFFSTYGDKSLFLKPLEKGCEKDELDDNKSCFTLDLELEKQVNLLTDDDEDDDLNEAKLNLGNDISNWSSTSSAILNPKTQSIHNLTTLTSPTVNIGNLFPSESQDNINLTSNFRHSKNSPHNKNTINNDAEHKKLSIYSTIEKIQDNTTPSNITMNGTNINTTTNLTNNTNKPSTNKMLLKFK